MPSHTAAPTFFCFCIFFFLISSLRSAVTCLIFCSDTKGVPRESTQTGAKRLHIKQPQGGFVFSFFCLHTSAFFIFSLIQETTERLVVGAFRAIFFVPDWRIIHFHQKQDRSGNTKPWTEERMEKNKTDTNKNCYAVWRHREMDRALSSAAVTGSSTLQQFEISPLQTFYPLCIVDGSPISAAPSGKLKRIKTCLHLEGQGQTDAICEQAYPVSHHRICVVSYFLTDDVDTNVISQ